ncbi:Uncharacterised protein [Chlamydia abortus]|nr:uncharacterized protein CHAB577_0088 [Chlamydia abortus]SFV98470.1 Uncharacterised protein [Chlamydia abortus]SFW00391.1 Uncharacterised protein [Chlamydia abortus]SFW00710.1 Uncharacterised protein [Chlamydia abortus]SFW02223.1 Uncharacterised protein [Chlamydia abortus]
MGMFAGSFDTHIFHWHSPTPSMDPPRASRQSIGNVSLSF